MQHETIHADIASAFNRAFHTHAPHPAQRTVYSEWSDAVHALDALTALAERAEWLVSAAEWLVTLRGR